jgi:hypothetical protein
MLGVALLLILPEAPQEKNQEVRPTVTDERREKSEFFTFPSFDIVSK